LLFSPICDKLGLLQAVGTIMVKRKSKVFEIEQRMADMTIKNKTKKKKLSEEEIDDIVISQADNDSEWEDAIHVRKTNPASLSIPPGLAARAAFLAHLHREARVEEWLMRIIRERVELEEGAFVMAKRELSMKERA
jgi:hypothetical protein